jgi:hypothetical protein
VVRFGADSSRVVLRGDDRTDIDAVVTGFALSADELFSTLHPG